MFLKRSGPPLGLMRGLGLLLGFRRPLGLARRLFLASAAVIVVVVVVGTAVMVMFGPLPLGPATGVEDSDVDAPADRGLLTRPRQTGHVRAFSSHC